VFCCMVWLVISTTSYVARYSTVLYRRTAWLASPPLSLPRLTSARLRRLRRCFPLCVASFVFFGFVRVKGLEHQKVT